ncbi:DUF1223 domain-containing protein [Flagellimonas sp. HMM57]|uniref:DUF1223 domain-containing protein n=1 Tax=unclassified Flagellimonas TaxID=2644544 RepID=UPI0013D136EA|nr:MULTISPECIES: DUF1223 domain-containing protein [unclassified Flagellimonas]UII76167.1 DUF1223 domain-containing protein [Flagellimonas sp. HMM57]
MFKKVIISCIALLGISLMGFYNGTKKKPVKYETDTAENVENTAVIVLELFTSQGCSSCPPADLLLEKVKEQYPTEVYALSYHVDYWNYIGWKDPFSKSVYTKKQRDYNIKFKSRSNYTPQLVVNGNEHFVGSNRSKLYSKIDAYKKLKSSNSVSLDKTTIKGNEVMFNYTIDGGLASKQLRAVLVLDERTTSVKRGENRNRALKNSNIVVMEKYVDLQSKFGVATIEIPSIVTPKEKLTLVLLVENDDLTITGAAKMRLER